MLQTLNYPRLFLFLILILSLKVNAVEVEKEKYFLRLQVANAEDGETQVLLGKILPQGLLVMTLNKETALIPFISAEEGRRIRKLRELEAPKEGESRSSISPQVQFSMNPDEIKKCTALREFQSFADQLPIFQQVIREFVLSQDGSAQTKACADKVLKFLTERKTVVYPSNRRWANRGLQLWARIYLEKEAGEIATFHKDSSEGHIQLRFQDGTEKWVEVQKNGYFFKSWKASDKNALPLILNYQSPQGHVLDAKIETLPRFKVGEDRVKFDDLSLTQISIASVDSAERMPVVLEERTKKRTLGVLLSSLSYQSNAFGTNSGAEVGATSDVEINRGFSLHGISYLPLGINTSKVKMTYVDLLLAYHPSRVEIGQHFDYRLELGPILYNVDAINADAQTGQLFASQIFGLDAGAHVQWEWSKSSLELGASVGPTSTGTSSSVLFPLRERLRYQYHWRKSGDFFALIQQDNFQLQVPTQSTVYSFTFTGLGLGYQMNF